MKEEKPSTKKSDRNDANRSFGYTANLIQYSNNKSMCSGSRHVTIGYRGAIEMVLTHFKLCAYSASMPFAWGMNKLFHASKNIDARNNWFMALSADLFVTSMSCYLFLVSIQSFALNGRSFAFVQYAFEWFFARSFLMFSSMCGEKSSA